LCQVSPVTELFTQSETALIRQRLVLPESLTHAALLVRGQAAEIIESTPDAVTLVRAALTPFLEALLRLLPCLAIKCSPAPGAIQQMLLPLGIEGRPVFLQGLQQVTLIWSQLFPGNTLLCQHKAWQ
jgi:hypothetical protein